MALAKFMVVKQGLWLALRSCSLPFLVLSPFQWQLMKSRNHKNVPRGIVLSLLITTVLYILVTLVLTGMVPFKNLNVDDAVAFALRQVGAGWAGNYVSLVAILTLITVCISMTFALSRMIYSLARDGLLPKAMKQLDPKTRIQKMRHWSLD